LTGAILMGATLDKATWTDGKRICAEPSISTCK